jgi:NAD(P) transhydrogenase
VPFDDPCVFDSETITGITRKPRELLIVGGGAIGVEYATILFALGAPVTILDNAPRLAAMMDGEIFLRLEQIFLARGEPGDHRHRRGLGAPGPSASGDRPHHR